MKKTTARLFNNDICWNIFDHTATPERFWDLQRQGKHSKARRAAIRLTIMHPIKMLPILLQRFPAVERTSGYQGPKIY